MILEYLQNCILNYGLIAAVLMMASNGFFSAPPSEAVLSIAGALLVNSITGLISVIFLLSIANLIGNYPLYFVGLKFGTRVLLKLRYFCRKSNVIFLRKLSGHLPNKLLLLKLEKQFNASGYKWVLILRCLPVIRSIIAIPAGAAEMKQSHFLLFSFVGMVAWSTGWVTFGYFMKSAWVSYQLYISIPLTMLLLITGLIVFKKYKTLSKQIILNNIR